MKDIVDAYNADKEQVYVKTVVDAIYTSENENENLKDKLTNIVNNISDNTTQLSENVQQIEAVESDLQTTNNALSVQKTRIDTFTKLNEGSTTGDAELIDARIGTDKVTYNNIGGAIREQFKKVNDCIGLSSLSATTNSGYYINTTGVKTPHSEYYYSNPIQLKKGEKIICRTAGYLTNVAIISICTKDGTIIRTSVISTDSELHNYEYTSETDLYICVSGNNKTGLVINKYTPTTTIKNNILEYLNVALGIKTLTASLNLGSYIIDGVIVNNASYFNSEPIKLEKGETLCVYTKGYNKNVSIFSSCDSEGKNLKTIAKDDGSNTYKTYFYMAESNIYIIVSGFLVDSLMWKKKDNHKQIDKEQILMSELSYYAMFENAVCIGDSLTEGYYPNYNDTKLRAFSYPSAMARKTGWAIKNLGMSGSAPSTWWKEHSSKDLSSYDVAFICFGRNGSLISSEDKTKYVEIINKIKISNSNCTIFLCAVPQSDYDNEDAINTIVKTIAFNNNVHYLDIHTNTIMSKEKGSIYRPSDGVHYNKIGYHQLSQEILNNMNYYIDTNLSKFNELYVPPRG